MSKEMEYEERVMLNYDQYLSILAFYMQKEPSTPILVQTNYYFDDKHFTLIKKHFVLRIRTVEDVKCELTLKIKGINGDTEINIPLSYNKAQELIDNFNIEDKELFSQLSKENIDVKDLKLIGSLRNIRSEFYDGDNLIVVDKNEYLDVVDYNLEVESASMENSKNCILKICNQFNLEYTKDYVSKSRRLLKKIYKS